MEEDHLDNLVTSAQHLVAGPNSVLEEDERDSTIGKRLDRAR
jgi:hypothetical protein